LQPPVYHAVRERFCIFALSENHLVSFHLDTIGVNDHEPLPALNACADCVSYSPILHQIKLCAKLEYAQGWSADRQQNYWSEMKRDGLRQTSQSCATCCVRKDRTPTETTYLRARALSILAISFRDCKIVV
jgi:hypothetical protein